MFTLESKYQPAGDQPAAIDRLTAHFKEGKKDQVLLGVTGSGKTFTVANVIQNLQTPTLVIAHNKTLAAQLYQEFRDFFPNNAVSYFVSYYDYYQPEAYIVSSDTYIEKEAMINDEIDKLRLATTANLLSRPDCIVVASVSCIYNIGAPEDFELHTLQLIEGELISRQTITRRLNDMQYTRTTADLARGTFRLRGDRLQLWPANEAWALTIFMPGDSIEKIEKIDPITGELWPDQTPQEENIHAKRFIIYPAKHNIAGKDQQKALLQIEADMRERVAQLKAEGKSIEAYRLEQRTLHDVDMLREIGFVNGIENYSRYFDGREPGDPPYTLLDYFNYNARKFGNGEFLTVVDESHMTAPQARGMFAGDRARKETLIEYGFRLPAARDNRPLQFPEFLERLDKALYVSATPDQWEIDRSNNTVVEQIVRPTGLTDPPVEIRPITGQIPDLLNEISIRKARGQRVLVTTLTKKMAETLTEYLNNEEKMKTLLTTNGYPAPTAMPKVQYLHSDVDTLERSEILTDLRKGLYDVLIGVNLLREGLDLPEVTLVAILDADQEGFLRSTSALIQTMGRAARHSQGQVILYADRVTKSMQAALEETDRRRTIQLAYNKEHNITPTTIDKPIREELIKNRGEDKHGEIPGSWEKKTARDGYHFPKHETTNKTELKLSKNNRIYLEDIVPDELTPQDRKKLASQLGRTMNNAAKAWNFELAASIRDVIAKLEI
jgi:excinuclease ABC subunit B